MSRAACISHVTHTWHPWHLLASVDAPCTCCSVHESWQGWKIQYQCSTCVTCGVLIRTKVAYLVQPYTVFFRIADPKDPNPKVAWCVQGTRIGTQASIGCHVLTGSARRTCVLLHVVKAPLKVHGDIGLHPSLA